MRSIEDWIRETVEDMIEEEKFEIISIKTNTDLARCYREGHDIIVQAKDFRDVANHYICRIFTFFCETCGAMDDLARVNIYED